MSLVDGLILSDDAPKENPWRDDKLGFRPFAERLSKVILTLQLPNGYVIGLHGEWGSGKSTAINFVKAFLEKHNVETDDETKRIDILDFRPWIISGHQDLISAFFKVLSEQLPGTTRPGWIDRTLRGVRGTADPVLSALATVALVVDPSGGVASKAAAKVAGTTLNRAIDRFLEEPSLQAAYEQLRVVLQKKHKRFLVVIDDLDRLQKDEIRSIMQMVKTVGRLPNVLYLLAYDRDIVWAALDEGITADRNGPNFGEKIVQQEIELPRPAKEDLLAILDSEVAFLTGPPPTDVRWLYMLRDGVRRWIKHPRDVQRLANAIKFSWPALEGEIDEHDLFIMEGLRLFEEHVFDWVRWNRDWLFNEGQYLMARDTSKKAGLKLLTDRVPEHEQEPVFRVLASLFPSQHKLFGEQFQQEAYFNIVRRRGIGCTAGYDAYFSLYPSSNEVQKSVIDEAVLRLDDREYLVDLIKSYIEKKDRNKRTMVSGLLQELTFRFMGVTELAPTKALLDALFEVGETILRIEWDAGPFQTSPQVAFDGLITELLKTWGDSTAGQHLEAAFAKSASPVINADVFVHRARELGVVPGSSGERPLVTASSLAALGKILLPQLERAAADGTLANAPYYWEIVGAWKYLGGAAAVKGWIDANMAANADFLSKLTMGLVGHSLGTVERVYSMHELPDPDLYDLNAMLAASKKHLAGRDLSKDARNRIEVVSEAIEGHLRKDLEKQTSETTSGTLPS